MASSVVPSSSETTTVPIKAPSTIPPPSSENFVVVQTAFRKTKKKITKPEEDEPLVDTTAALAKNSKKTKRLVKQQQRKQAKAALKPRLESFLDLPAELLQEILGYLEPTDLFRAQLLNQATRDFILHHERAIAKDVMDRRYSVLRRCFPLPVALGQVDAQTQTALLNPRRERMTEIHKKPYQHIKPMDTQKVCSCPSCLLAWNDLSVVLDFGHFQTNLDHREPIDMIPRGTEPEWNTRLTEKHAAIVEKAMARPLAYAAILQIHLKSIIGTLLRQTRSPRHVPKHQHSKRLGSKTVHPTLLYSVTERDDNGHDDFLERAGRPSIGEFPFHRDRYYSLLAYVPNRRWVREQQIWVYYAQGAHERDLEWMRRWFLPRPEDSRDDDAFLAQFRAAMVTT